MDVVVECKICGVNMHGRPTTHGRCLDCYMLYMRKLEPWDSGVSNFEEQAAESERWREGLRKAWENKTLDT